jgi:hypothetical protein
MDVLSINFERLERVSTVTQSILSKPDTLVFFELISSLLWYGGTPQNFPLLGIIFRSFLDGEDSLGMNYAVWPV